MKSKKVVWFSLLVAILVVSTLSIPAGAALAEEPLHIIFIAGPTRIHAGECALLEWHVEGGFAVVLQGQPVPQLGVDMGDRVEWRDVAIVVEGSAPPPQSPPPEPPAAQPAPQPAPKQPAPKGPVTINFRADRTNLNPGECTRLRWDVENVNEVYLDGKGVVGHSSKVVCPPQGRTYVLHVVHPGGPTEKKVTVKVSGGSGPAPQPKNPGAGKSADLAVTDLYPGKLPYGRVWMRVTNHGPATLTGATIQIKCNAQGTPLNGGKPWSHVEAPWKATISLKPGQTASIQTKVALDATKYKYTVTCSAVPPSNGAAFQDPNWSNNSFSEAIAAKSGAGPKPGAPFKANAVVTDLFAKKLRGGKLFARITNRGPGTLVNAKASLVCQGAGFQGSNPVGISRTTVPVLNLKPGQTGIYDTGITINIDQYDYYEMACRVEAPYASGQTYAERIP